MDLPPADLKNERGEGDTFRMLKKSKAFDELQKNK